MRGVYGAGRRARAIPSRRMPLEPLPAGAPGDAEPRIIEPLCAVFRRQLKAEGLKYTPERAQILDAVLRTEGLFEADRLLESMRREGLRVSKATIYRTLHLLLSAGIIQRVPLDDDQSHYQVVYGRHPHDLLIRLDTGEAVPIDLPGLVEMRDALCRARGLEPQGHRLHIFAVGAGAAARPR